MSKRTFFRYFESKADVLWNAFDAEVDNLRHTLAAMPTGQPVMDAVRQAVLDVNHYRAEDVPELRTRMTLLSSVPELSASASVHYDAWEAAISSFVADRTGRHVRSLYPMTVGRATLATCRAAYERWAALADADLTVYLDAALGALLGGFADETLTGSVEW